MHTHLRQVIDQVETGAYTPTSSTGTSSAARPDGTHNHSQTYNTSVQTYGRCTYSPVTNTHAPDQNIQQNTHRHGLKFQAVSLPIGLCVLHGPLLGPDHDATIPRLSTIEQNLSDMTARQRHLDPNFQPYCVYGDTAYYDNTHVRRATQHAVSTAAQRTVNDVYKPLRVLVEQQFACISQLHGIVRVQLSLGTGPTGMVYPVCALLSNVHCLLYGNCVSASVPGAEQVLSALSLESYLHL